MGQKITFLLHSLGRALLCSARPKACAGTRDSYHPSQDQPDKTQLSVPAPAMLFRANTCLLPANTGACKTNAPSVPARQPPPARARHRPFRHRSKFRATPPRPPDFNVGRERRKPRGYSPNLFPSVGHDFLLSTQHCWRGGHGWNGWQRPCPRTRRREPGSRKLRENKCRWRDSEFGNDWEKAGFRRRSDGLG